MIRQRWGSKAVSLVLLFVFVLSTPILGTGDKGGKHGKKGPKSAPILVTEDEDGEERPKIVLDSVSVTEEYAILAEYRVLPTDALMGKAHADPNKLYFIRQTIEILDQMSEVVVRTFTNDFPIEIDDLKNASEYVAVSTEDLWDGKDADDADLPSGLYTYRVSAIYLRVNVSGKGQAQGMEKEIAASSTLSGEIILGEIILDGCFLTSASYSSGLYTAARLRR